MFQNARTRLVAPGLASPVGLEALVLEPWADAAREADRLLAAVTRADGRAGEGRGGEGRADAQENAWVPAVDVVEREDAIRLAVEVPGVDPAALDVTVNDRVLTVSGERRLARPEGATAYRLERRYGRFARSLTLPRTVDAERIAARYEHGVLHLELPKRPEAQPRRIAVSAGAAPTPGADDRRIEAGNSQA